MNTIGIVGYGFYDFSSIAGSTNHRRYHPPTIDEIKWRDISQEPFKRFGQLDALSKSVLVATEMIGIEHILGDEIKTNTAIVLGTKEGCLGTDIDFHVSALERTVANPRLFAYTLPSTVCGDIAIRYRLLGPNVCFLAGDDSGILALEEGFHLIASGEVDACLCVGADALFTRPTETATAHGMLLGESASAAYAFMVTRKSAVIPPLLCEFTQNDSAAHNLDTTSSLEDVVEWLEASETCIPTIRIG